MQDLMTCPPRISWVSIPYFQVLPEISEVLTFSGRQLPREAISEHKPGWADRDVLYVGFQFFHLYYTFLILRGLISRTHAAKQQSSTADSFLPIRSPENQGVIHLLTASEVDKGKKNTDAPKTIALIIDELQHVAISFQHSTASLTSMLPPEMLKEGRTQSSLFKHWEMQRALQVRNGNGNLCPLPHVFF